MLKPFVCASILALLLQAPAPLATPKIEKIADGVFVAMRPEPAGVFLDANSIFLVGPDDVIVIDTNASPSSARASLAALTVISPKPVRAVINTHWHQDHISGNQVYREAFPKAEFIAHAAAAMPSTAGVSNRGMLDTLSAALVEEMRMGLDQNRSMGGGPLGDDERASHLADIARAQRYLTESASLEIAAPTRLVQERITLKQGARTIDVLALGRGHSAADLVVHLPGERIVIAGDLIATPLPKISSLVPPTEFVRTLNALLALKPSVIVPGHGAPIRDDKPVHDEILLLESISKQVGIAVAGGATERQVRAMVNVDAIREDYTGTSAFNNYLFNLYAFQPAVLAAYREITKK